MTSGGQILIFGRRRQGKSTLALRLATAMHQRVIVFDPNNQFLLVPAVATLQEFAAWIDDEEAAPVIRFTPEVGEIEDDFDAICALLWPLGNYALIVDEASCVQDSHGISPALERLVRQAPRDGFKNNAGQPVDVTVIQTLHRPGDAHNICRALATDHIYFSTTHERDKEVIRKQFGDDAAAATSTLPRHHCVHMFNEDGTEVFSVWNQPEDWNVRITDLC